MTFTGDIGPRVISDGLIFCVDFSTTRCREENDYMDLVTKTNCIHELCPTVIEDGIHCAEFTKSPVSSIQNNNVNIDPILETGELTFECLVKITQAGDLIGFGGYHPYWGYTVRCNFNNGYLRPYLYYQNSSGAWQSGYGLSMALSLGEWTYIAITYDGTDQKLYKNGELKYTETLDPTGSTGSVGGQDRVRCGVNGWGSPDGHFSFLKVYKRALTQEEISHNYNVAKRTRGVL